MPYKINLTSFENASLLRKLTILYFLMSIVPVVFLYFLYLQLMDYGRIVITEESFRSIFTLVVIGVAVGYFALRSMIMRIIHISQDSHESLQALLGAERIRAISAGSSNEISILAKSFTEITARLEDNVRNLELAKKTLHSVLSRVGQGISSMDNIDSFLTLIVETMTDALASNQGVLLLRDEKREDLFVKTVYGKNLPPSKNIRIGLDHVLFTAVAEEAQAVVLDHLPRDQHALCQMLSGQVLCAPLLLHDHIMGVIAVAGRQIEQSYDEEEKSLLTNLALQTAVAVENSKLNEDAEKTYFETISALAMAVEAKDPYSRGHSDRVANFAVSIAQEMALPPEELKALRDAAKLHDLGKIGVMDKILRKPSALNAQEVEMMKKHPEIGEGIIKPIRCLRNLCDLVRHHHEKLDGSGYPDGLKGDEIHTLVRILQIADIYDALTSDRPYRDPFSPEKAIETLRSMRDQIDMRIVDVLARVVQAG